MKTGVIQTCGEWTGTKAKGFTCDWFCAWGRIGDQKIAGVASGYLGSSTYLCTEFYARFSEGRVVELVDLASGRDLVSDESIDDTLYRDLQALCGDVTTEAGEIHWTWNDSEVWEDEELMLLQDKVDLLPKAQRKLSLETAALPFSHVEMGFFQLRAFI